VKRLLIVGWDAADWKVINPLLARGEMPHLARLMSEGVHGNIATIYPALSPMLWTSIATGKRPGKHGILGFSEPAEDGMRVRPVSNLGRKTKAFWNILNQHGKRSIVVGWWPSHPAEPISGAMVSNHFPFQPWDDPQMPLAPGTVWPAEHAAEMAELRVHPMEISPEILRLFVPDWQKVDQDQDKSLHDLAGIIAETMSIHASATHLMEHEPWDVAAIYYSGIDHFSHRFMRYHAGKAPERGTSDAAWFAGVVLNAYRYHDLMLGRLRALAGPDCAVMLLSDHGFHSDALLPDYVPAEAAGPAVEHRHFGIFCLKAPGVKRGERLYGANVLDIAPTVLHLFNLPTGLDMDGRVLINAFDDQRMQPPIPSWDQVPGDDGRHPPSRQYDGISAAESLKQLVALGYVAPPGDDGPRSVSESVTESRYNLARSYMDEGRPDLSAAILRELIAEDRQDARLHQHLFFCHMQTGDHAGAGRVLNALDCACAEGAPKAAAELERRRAERPDSELRKERASADTREAYERRKLAERAAGAVVDRLFLRVRLELAKARTRARKEAVRPMVERLAKMTGGAPGAGLFLAEAFGAIGDSARALQYTRRVLRADPENAQAFALEARLHCHAGRYEDAVASAVESLALIYCQPLLHCIMGSALHRMREFAQAEQAFRVALAQAPGLTAAHEGLARLLRRDRSRTGEAAWHMAQAAVARERRKQRPAAAAEERVAPGMPQLDGEVIGPPADRSKVVTIVSGLPRSGTSMMMQMLAAGGIESYSDGRRAPDEDNPRGYFEHAQATRLHQDTSWVPEARGKAVKIVAHLLPYLPRGEEYRIIFMHRALEEVTASQTAMLKRLGRKGAALDEAALSRTYAGQLVRVQEWLKKASGVSVLPVQYAQVLEVPTGAALKLAAFVGEPFDPAAAAASVDPGLRRQNGQALHNGVS
jgi:predicted AlkP superfamily phosphohydrolase/phosphomutase/tetratricopeptide (TPR) repeat protein